MVISDVRSLSLYLSVMPGPDYAMPVACAASRQFAELRCLLFIVSAEHRTINRRPTTLVCLPLLLGSSDEPAVWAGRPGSASLRIENAVRSWGCVPLKEPTHQWSATCKVSTGRRFAAY